MKNRFNCKVLKSSDSNVFKFIFTKEDVAVEAVLYRYGSFRERTVICCSVQCGCPVGCTFCGTGRGFVRNLTADEIVDEVVQVMETVDCQPNEIKKFQIMFMSMGEPFLNQMGLFPAIAHLANLYPSAALLVSTSAPRNILSGDAWLRFSLLSMRLDRLGLQFSVHESVDEARARLIPTPTCSLAEISELGRRWASMTGRKPFYNYCVYAGNDTDEDVERLVSLFPPCIWDTTLSVICEKHENVKASVERQLDLIQSFAKRMTKAGASIRVFNPAGQDDIGGGCGQLWFFQKWLRENSTTTHVEKGASK